MEPSWNDVDAVLRRLKLLLTPRAGPTFAASMLRELVNLKERGASASVVLASAVAHVDAWSAREPLAAPFSSPVCRAVADAGALKLSMLASRLSWQQPHRGLSDAEHRAVADHAAALVPTFGDADLCIGMGWKNALLFRLSLVVGECWSRNDGTPLTDLAAASADFALDDRSVAVAVVRGAVVRGAGVVVARGHVPPSDTAPFRVRSWACLRHGHDPIVVERDGSFVGVRALLTAWALPITPATLPWIVHASCMSAVDDDVVVDDADGVVAAFVGGEDALEQERFQGPAGALVKKKLGLTSTTPSRERLRLRIGATEVVYVAGGELVVDGGAP